MQQLIWKQWERCAVVLAGDLQSIFSLGMFSFWFCLNSQGIVNTLVTPNGFFVKFQGASVLCLLSELCLLLHLFLLVARLTCQRTPILLEADVVLVVLCRTRD